MKKTVIATAVGLMLSAAAIAAPAWAEIPADPDAASLAVNEAIGQAASAHVSSAASVAQVASAVPLNPRETLQRGQTIVANAASVADLAQRQQQVAEAVRLLKPLAQAGNVDANYDLGYLLADGVGMPRDLAGAIPYMRKAADGGNAKAAAWLAEALTGQDAQHYTALHEQLASRAVVVPVVATASKPAKTTTPCTQLAMSCTRDEQAPTIPPVKVAPVKTRPAPTAVASVIDPKPAPAIHTTHIAKPDPVCPSDPYTPAYVASLKRTIMATAQRNIELSEEVVTLQSRLSAQTAAPAALNTEAVTAINAGDYETALPKLRQAAAANYAPAVSNLGVMYLNGYVVKQDSRQAIALFSRAADAGDNTAAMNLWKIFQYGIGVQPDPSRAGQALALAQRLQGGQK